MMPDDRSNIYAVQTLTKVEETLKLTKSIKGWVLFLSITMIVGIVGCLSLTVITMIVGN